MLMLRSVAPRKDLPILHNAVRSGMVCFPLVFARVRADTLVSDLADAIDAWERTSEGLLVRLRAGEREHLLGIVRSQMNLMLSWVDVSSVGPTPTEIIVDLSLPVADIKLVLQVRS